MFSIRCISGLNEGIDTRERVVEAERRLRDGRNGLVVSKFSNDLQLLAKWTLLSLTTLYEHYYIYAGKNERYGLWIRPSFSILVRALSISILRIWLAALLSR